MPFGGHRATSRHFVSGVKIPARQLQASLKRGLSPCYLVTGDEPLLVQEALDAIRAKARQQDFDTRELHVAEAAFDWRGLGTAAANLSLFAERRIVELRLPTGKPGLDGAAAIVDLVQKTGDDLLLLVSAPKSGLTAAAKWIKAIESSGVLVEVWPVDRQELPDWINARMRRAGLIPDGDAVRLIADRVEGNLLAADQEIEKLRLLLGEGRVSGADVDSAVADSSRYDIFKMTDAAVAGDAARAVRILGTVRAEGVVPVLVIWALTRQLRTLAGLAENIEAGLDLATALKKARVWGRRESIVRASVERHSARDLYRLLKLARQADAAAKGQLALDPWRVTADIVLGLALGVRFYERRQAITQ